MLSKTQDEVWNFFEKLAWDTYRLKHAHPLYSESAIPVSRYPQDHFIDSHDPSFSYVSPVLCECCDSYDHDTCNCPYRAYVDVTCASVEKKLNELTDQMVENMKVRIA